MTWWVAGAAVVGSIGGALISSDAAGNAADTQAGATRESNATQKAMYDQTRQDNMPALEARNASLARMRELLGIGGDQSAQGYGTLGGAVNPGDVTQDPGYQFGMQQGQQSLNNQLTARGMRNSGAALKAAARFGNDYATTKYDNAFNRQIANRSAQLNPLQSVAGLGQTGASTVSSAGQNYANQVGANQIGLGNALGASSIAQGNAWGNALQQGAGWYANQQRQQAPASGYGTNASGQYVNIYDDGHGGLGW